MSQVFILFENMLAQGVPHTSLLFQTPQQEILCDEPASVRHTLCQIDALRQKGYYLAGFISYDACFSLLDIQTPSTKRNAPLIHFYAFKQPSYLTRQATSDFLGEEQAHIFNVGLNITSAQYAKMFSQVKAHLTAGDSYQINLTSKYTFEFDGSIKGLYNALRTKQKVAYASLFNTENHSLVSLSPELFFAKIKNKLHLKPMKGTMPRMLDAHEDAKAAHFLKHDLKSIAENTMIVDLLRNDAATISSPGSVYVPSLLDVESYETLHQMTSKIESVIDEKISFLEVIQALFPCGSITGAPKRRTIELIADIEQAARGIYTGSIGYITPQNDMCFNVAIRTAYCPLNQVSELGVGGGIVFDSNEAAEFEELQLKARFLTSLGC